MHRIHLAELRDSWSAWLGVSLAFFTANLSFVMSSLVLVSGWNAVNSGLATLEATGEYTLVPISNYVFSGMVSLSVISMSTLMVVDSRRGSLARLAMAGAEPKTVIRTVMTQLVAVCLANAVLADAVALVTLNRYLHFLAFRMDPNDQNPLIPGIHNIGVVLASNVGVVVVALVGGYWQARRGSRIPPVEALRCSAVDPSQKMTILRWLTVVPILGLLGLIFAVTPGIIEFSGKEAASNILQIGLGTIILVVVLMGVLAPVLVSPLARLWTAAVPLRSPAWKIARRNIYTRGARFSRSVIPVVFTIGLMLGILSLAPTIEGTVQSVFGKGETMSNAGIGAFLSMMGWALAIALAGGVGNVIMMSKQRDADLALMGISGATPAQRVAITLIEGFILTVTATMLALVAIAVEAVYFQTAFSAMGFDPVFIIPPQAWIVGCGGTLVIMLAAMALPTLPALRRPEPRVVARLVAE